MAKKEKKRRKDRRKREPDDLKRRSASELSALFNRLAKGKRAQAIGAKQRANLPLSAAQRRQVTRASAVNSEINRRYATARANDGPVGRDSGQFR